VDRSGELQDKVERITMDRKQQRYAERGQESGLDRFERNDPCQQGRRAGHQDLPRSIALRSAPALEAGFSTSTINFLYRSCAGGHDDRLEVTSLRAGHLC
jgi:hypothetical protein